MTFHRASVRGALIAGVCSAVAFGASAAKAQNQDEALTQAQIQGSSASRPIYLQAITPPTQTKLRYYLALCAAGQTVECNGNVGNALAALQYIYGHSRSSDRSWHRGLSSASAFTGAGLAVGGAFFPPVALTGLAIAVASPIMIDDLTRLPDRANLSAATVGALQLLTARYAAIKAYAQRSVNDYGPFGDVPPLGAAPPYTPPKFYSDLKADCDILNQESFIQDTFTVGDATEKTAATAVTTEVTNLRNLCGTVLAQAEPASPLGQLMKRFHDDAPSNKDEDEIDTAFANDALSLIDASEQIQRNLDPTPVGAFGTMVAAPVTAIGNLIKGQGTGSSIFAAQSAVALTDSVNITVIDFVSIPTTAYTPALTLDPTTAAAFTELSKDAKASTAAGHVKTEVDTLIPALASAETQLNAVYADLVPLYVQNKTQSVSITIGPTSYTVPALQVLTPAPSSSTTGTAAKSGS